MNDQNRILVKNLENKGWQKHYKKWIMENKYACYSFHKMYLLENKYIPYEYTPYEEWTTQQVRTLNKVLELWNLMSVELNDGNRLWGFHLLKEYYYIFFGFGDDAKHTYTSNYLYEGGLVNEP